MICMRDKAREVGYILGDVGALHHNHVCCLDNISMQEIHASK